MITMCFNGMLLLLLSVLTLTASLSSRKSDRIFNQLLKKAHKENSYVEKHVKRQESRSDFDLQHLVERLNRDEQKIKDPLDPPVRYLLDVFGRLQAGQGLSEASGHPMKFPSISMADTVRTFKTKVEAQDSTEDIHLSVNLTRILMHEKIQLAELHIAARHAEKQGRWPRKLRISNRQDKPFLRPRWQPAPLRGMDKNGMLVYDVTEVVKDAAKHKDASVSASNKVDLIIRWKSRNAKRNKNRKAIRLNEEKDTILVVFTKDTGFFEELNQAVEKLAKTVGDVKQDKVTASRRKRSADANKKAEQSGKKSSKGKRKPCHRNKFFVDFDLIGWGKWIVYPKRFNAYICKGRCPQPVHANYSPTNHALMQSLMRLKEKSGTPRPCCVPTKLTPLSMLYNEESGQIVVRHHEGMVAKTCGCR